MTDTPNDTPAQLVTFAGFLDLRSRAGRPISDRTLKRWLADGIPGAMKLDGAWLIPADYERPDQPARGPVPTPSTAVERSSSGMLQQRPPISQLVDTLPGFVPLEIAAEALGISVHAIRRHRDEFGLQPLGEHGALVMPRREIKAILG
jgi:hypothetical protein